MAAAATARVSAAVSYLRLLTALVTRAPSADEAAGRARLLIAALVSAVGTQSRILTGRDAGAAVAAFVPAPTPSSGGSTTQSGGVSVRGGPGGVGVRVRSAASDSAVLCMQTLKYLLDWADQAVGSGGGSGGGGGGKHPPPAAVQVSTNSSKGGDAGASYFSAVDVDAAIKAAEARALGGGLAGDGSGRTEPPSCLHGLRARVIVEHEGGAATGLAGFTASFVCPFADTPRRCSFVQAASQPVRARTAPNKFLLGSTNMKRALGSPPV